MGGWRLSNIVVLQGCLPFSVYTSQPYPFGDFNADGAYYDFPNAPAFGSNILHSRGDFQKGIFTKADFPLPAPGVSGSLGRNSSTGPGFANVNTRMLGETTTLEVTGELFNAFNRVNLSGVSSDMTSATFGRSTTSSGPRQVQFGVRVAF